MPYAVITDGVITEYPVDLSTRLPGTSFPENWLWAAGEIDGTEYVAIQPTPRPDYNPATQNITEGAPLLVDGAWMQQWSVVDASAEEIAERLEARREAQAVPAWQARYILATMPSVTEGPLAAAPGATLLEQIDAFAAQVLDAPALERFKGATTWQRLDPMLLQLSALAGLDDAAIDAWFAAAGQVQ